jgi:hypothetical protein
MRQLVGLSCVLCQKSIPSVVEGRFCDACHCPVHVQCARRGLATAQAPGCTTCGATAEDVAHQKQLHRQDELERQQNLGAVGHIPGDWPVMLVSSGGFRNPLMNFVRDDQGSLEWSPGEIRVIGNQVHEFKEVFEVSLVAQPISWLSLALGNLGIAAMTFGGLLTVLTPTEPITWILWPLLNILFIVMTIMTKWIRISYRNQTGVNAHVYLQPVTSAGKPRRFDGACRQLWEILAKGVLRREPT